MADAESSIRGMLGCQTQEEVVRILSFFHYLQVFATVYFQKYTVNSALLHRHSHGI